MADRWHPPMIPARNVIAEVLTRWISRELPGDCADRILASLNEAGLAVVPKEPTGEMIRAGDSEIQRTAKASETWRAMIRAILNSPEG
jgi:hypothetical protein